MNKYYRHKKPKLVKLWYLGRRDNPQLPKPYYIAYGQLLKQEVEYYEDCLYGKMTLIPYETEEEYNKEIERLRLYSFRVTVQTHT